LKKLQYQLHGALKAKDSIFEIRKLQNSIITAFSARVIAVRTVTTNKGKNIPGVDGIT
jgi:hypothetical protein